MSRSPCVRRRLAAILGVASIALMPVAFAGPASADPAPPVNPTTTVVPAPQLPVPQQIPQPVLPPVPPVVQVPPVAPPPVIQQAPPEQVPVLQPPVIAPPPEPAIVPRQSLPQPPVDIPSPQAPVIVKPPPVQTPVEVPTPPAIQTVPKQHTTQVVPPSPPPWENPAPEQHGSNVPPAHDYPTPGQPPGGCGQNCPPTTVTVPPPHGTPGPGDNPGSGHQPPPGWHPGDNGSGQPCDQCGQPGHQPGDDNGRPPGSPWPHPDQPPSDCNHDCPPPHPVPLPGPPGGWNPGQPSGFPDWGHNSPHPCGDQNCPPPVPIGNHNPPPHCDGGPQGCLPPPVLPGDWHNPWLDHCNNDCHQPPPNPDVFVHNDIHNNVVIVNNIVNTNTNIFVTNLSTGAVWNFPQVPYGTPYAFPPNWCGGAGGGFAWSANVGTPFAGASFAGGGYFNANAGCGIVPYVPPPAPLYIVAPGYPEYYADNYVQPPNCGCVYVNNTYIYGQQQQVQGRMEFVPSSWTPDIVTQPAKQGLPPFLTGVNPVPKAANPTGLAAMMHREWQPIAWGGAALVVVAIAAALWVSRHRAGGSA